MGGRKEERNRCRQDLCKYVGYELGMQNKKKIWATEQTLKNANPLVTAFGYFFSSPEMAKGPISNVYITGGSSANGARYPGRWELRLIFNVRLFCSGSFITTPPPSALSDGCTDGTMASSSNDSHYSGSRVETPVSYMGDDDEEDEYDENDDED